MKATTEPHATRAFSVARTPEGGAIRVGWVMADSGVFDFTRRPLAIPVLRITRTQEAS